MKEKSWGIKVREYITSVWDFIWNDNSIWSWVVNIILAFLLIKYLVYPGIGFALQTTHPIVAVVSGSMHHDQGFEEWWITPMECHGTKHIIPEVFYSSYNISQYKFFKYRFRNGFDKGDIMILVGVDPGKIQQGDVIVFKTNRVEPLIHRVISMGEDDDGIAIRTKGDNNCESLGEEMTIREEQIIGKAVIRIKWLGWVKIAFVSLVAAFADWIRSAV